MSDFEQINLFLVDIFGRISRIEEHAVTVGLNHSVSITEIHIIDKIGAMEPVRMSEVAKSIGVTMATLTVACDKMETKELIMRKRDQADRRVVKVSLTDKGRAAYVFHQTFHARMTEAIMQTLTPEESDMLCDGLQRLQDFFISTEAQQDEEK